MAVVRDLTNAGATRAKVSNADGPADTFSSLHQIDADGVLSRKQNYGQTVEEILGDGRRRAPILTIPPVGQPGETYLIDIGGVTYYAFVDSSGVQQLLSPATGSNSYTHIQTAPAANWIVVHNLNRYPSAVAVIDSGGTVCMGAIVHNSLNQLTISFGAPFSGRAEVR